MTWRCRTRAPSRLLARISMSLSLLRNTHGRRLRRCLLQNLLRQMEGGSTYCQWPSRGACLYSFDSKVLVILIRKAPPSNLSVTSTPTNQHLVHSHHSKCHPTIQLARTSLLLRQASLPSSSPTPEPRGARVVVQTTVDSLSPRADKPDQQTSLGLRQNASYRLLGREHGISLLGGKDSRHKQAEAAQ